MNPFILLYELKCIEFFFQALKALRCSDLMPYVIYIGPPNLVKLKELKTKTNEAYRVMIYIIIPEWTIVKNIVF